ncbi:vomeronasal type-2 receptor, partial [Pristimantis euphronides]
QLTKHIKHLAYTGHSGVPVPYIYNNKVTPKAQVHLVHCLLLEEQKNTFVARTNLVASFDKSLRKEKLVDIDLGKLAWKNDQKPESRCNERCSPGYRKAPNGEHQVCCYDCVPCSEGEVSNITDSEICHKCPIVEWPDEKKVRCVPRIYEFLSYDKDIMSLVLSVLALFLSAGTLFILGLFIYYWDTPIVKANNRTVSFILLVSIFLSFLCVFFFLGRPVDITCLLRQTSFGIFFSIGVSSVLAKTITVCIAFKATKPGSSWMKLVSIKVSNYVVLICSSVQVLICIIWLSVSPPYVEYDHHIYPGKIIIQCNEGSAIWLLLYIGLYGAPGSGELCSGFHGEDIT